MEESGIIPLEFINEQDIKDLENIKNTIDIDSYDLNYINQKRSCLLKIKQLLLTRYKDYLKKFIDFYKKKVIFDDFITDIRPIDFLIVVPKACDLLNPYYSLLINFLEESKIIDYNVLNYCPYAKTNPIYSEIEKKILSDLFELNIKTIKPKYILFVGSFVRGLHHLFTSNAINYEYYFNERKICVFEVVHPFTFKQKIENKKNAMCENNELLEDDSDRFLFDKILKMDKNPEFIRWNKIFNDIKIKCSTFIGGYFNEHHYQVVASILTQEDIKKKKKEDKTKRNKLTKKPVVKKMESGTVLLDQFTKKSQVGIDFQKFNDIIKNETIITNKVQKNTEENKIMKTKNSNDKKIIKENKTIRMKTTKDLKIVKENKSKEITSYFTKK